MGAGGLAVPAHRKYSDAQRHAIWRLYRSGLNAAAISRQCAEGTPSVKPFHVPRRTAHEIARAIEREESETRRPENFGEATDPQAAREYPGPTRAILQREFDRIAALAHSGKPLPESDIRRLAAIEDVERRLARRTAMPSPQPFGRSRAEPDGDGSTARLLEAIRRG